MMVSQKIIFVRGRSQKTFYEFVNNDGFVKSRFYSLREHFERPKLLNIARKRLFTN